MVDLDTRLLAFAVWGIGTTLIYGKVLDGRFRRWRRRHDIRANREFASAFALFLTALCACLAIFVGLFFEAGTSPRQLITAIALGAFAAAGVVMVTEPEPTPK